MDKVPNYTVPERYLQMQNGERWAFRFDNAALDCLEKEFGGAPSTLEMYFALTAYHREKYELAVTFKEFKLQIMPQVLDPAVKSIVDSLMAEVRAKQDAIQAKPGNVPAAEGSPPPAESDGSGGTTSGE